jgi:twinkle protein
MNIGEVSEKLSHRADEIAIYLLPRGRKSGGYWKVGNIDGDAGDSLAIHLDGVKAGHWTDFATGEYGDLIDLWKAVKGTTMTEAFRQAKAYLGINEPQFQPKKSKTYREAKAEKGVKKVSVGSPVYEYLTTERGLTAEIISLYCLGEKEEGDRWLIVFPLKRDNKIINIKYLYLDRPDGKKDTRLTTGCELCLFGWQTISDNDREVIICEGEIDAMSWRQQGYAALSVPNGCKSLAWIENDYERLERFQTISLSFDMDEEGRNAIPKIISRLGQDRIRDIKLPVKDANELLLGGGDFSKCFDLAAYQDPTELKNAAHFTELVIETFYPSGGEDPGFVLPFSYLKKRFRFRPGELTVWSGTNGHGKSLILSYATIASAFQSERLCIASTEVSPQQWLNRAVKQVTAQERPSVEFIKFAMRWFGQWMWVFNVVGKSKAERVVEVFEYARKRYGIRQFAIDSLMKLGFADDDYNGQKNFVEILADYALHNGVHVHLVAHSRKGENESKASRKMDVKGSGAITDLASNVITIWKNKPKFEELRNVELQGTPPSMDTLEQPDFVLHFEKQRNGEWEGKVPLWFRSNCLQFVEDIDDVPRTWIMEPTGDYEPSPDDDEFNVDISSWVTQ